jgi:hypothetical protein
MTTQTNTIASNSSSSDTEKTADPPWKHEGYPAFTKWASSSNDFFLLRRFSRTSTRVLLYLQNEIAELGRKLDDMDEFTMNLPGNQGGCGSFRLDHGSPREEVIEKLAPLLKEHCTMNPVFAIGNETLEGKGV